MSFEELPDEPNGLHFDREGKPIGLRTWSKYIADPEYKVIEQTVLGKYFISTVWLGLYSNILGEPLIFETMVFNPPSFTDLMRERYHTEELARQGHQKMVEYIRVMVGSTNGF